MLKSIIFHEYQDSALDSGEYTIRLDQALKVNKGKPTAGSLDETMVRTLIVQGKRFALDPADIASVYPAPGSDGDYTAVMPHIMLNLKTLPWQRSPDGIVRSGRKNNIPNYPWLALVVFNESDGIPIAKKITLNDLWTNRSGLAPWINATTLDDFLEYGEKADDPVTVIDVDRASLTGLLPSPADLALLAHVRGEDGGNDFQAVLVANRLPKSGERHSVHLVSLMHCYQSITTTNANQVLLTGTGNDFRLVSLHNWTFYCEDTSDFKQRLLALNQDLFRLPTPANLTPDIQNYFKAGFSVLPHHLRMGRDTASLYRGPLSAGVPAAPALTLTVESADHLLIYDRKSGMLDVSYAAAWTLGRQLALEDKTFALDVYKYKRRQSIKGSRVAAASGISHLAVGKQDYTEEDNDLLLLKDKILAWLDQYQTLQNIPFQYLAPQEALLPDESIRFFRIDPFWVQCLQHGALSLGGDLTAGPALVPNVAPERWAFLLRSKVVVEFPKLRIEGYADKKTDLEDRTSALFPTVRKLADDVLFVYFNDLIQTVDVFLDPTNLYFGFREETGGVLVKDLKNSAGAELEVPVTPPVNPPQMQSYSETVGASEWRIDRANGVLKVDTWAKKMQTKLTIGTAPTSAADKDEFALFTSADFALQMVEGAPRVRFFVGV